MESQCKKYEERMTTPNTDIDINEGDTSSEAETNQESWPPRTSARRPVRNEPKRDPESLINGKFPLVSL